MQRSGAPDELGPVSLVDDGDRLEVGAQDDRAMFEDDARQRSASPRRTCINPPPRNAVASLDGGRSENMRETCDA